MRLTTVICNYNTRGELARALDSLLATQDIWRTRSSS